jgi:hypothetical protein
MRTVPVSMVAAIIVALSASIPGALADVTVLGSSFSPEKPTPDDAISFTIEVEGSPNVSKAYLTYCSIDSAVCYPPKEMTYVGAGVYTIDAGKFAEGHWKFNITLQLKDQNTTTTPDTHFNVTKETPGNGNGDHNNTTDGNTSNPGENDVPPAIFIAVGAIAIVAVAAVVLMKKKKPVGK